MKRKLFSELEIDELRRVLGLASSGANTSEVDSLNSVAESVVQSHNVEEEENSLVQTLSDETVLSGYEAEIPPEDRPMFIQLQQYFHN